MEICDKSVQNLEVKARVNKNIRVPLASFYLAVSLRRAFKGAAGRCADGDDPSPRRLGAVYQLRRFFGNGKMLAVHFVVKDVLLLNGTESSQPHMEGNIGKVYALAFQIRKHFPGKVKSRRGSRRGAELTAVDGLVTLLIGQLFGNIGGQGHLSNLVQYRKKTALTVKFCNAVAALHGFQNFRA